MGFVVSFIKEIYWRGKKIHHLMVQEIVGISGGINNKHILLMQFGVKFIKFYFFILLKGVVIGKYKFG